MSDLKEIERVIALAERLRTLRGVRGAFAVLSRKSGISQAAIVKIADGSTPNPGILTVGKIEGAMVYLAGLLLGGMKGEAERPGAAHGASGSAAAAAAERTGATV